jgi:hypothetical protein
MIGTMGKILKYPNGSSFSTDIAQKMSGSKARGDFFKVAIDIIASFFRVLALPLSKFDTRIKFIDPNQSNLVMGTKHKVVYFPTMRLSFLKELKNRANVTINDVLMAVTAGAIRRYCLWKGDPTIAPGAQCRALIPVAFPRSDKELQDPANALKNKWAFVSANLPIGSESSSDRLSEANKQMKQMKSSPMAFVQLWVQNNILPLMPRSMRQKTALDLFSRHSMVFSNVPGPGEALSIAGQRILGMQVIFPNLISQTMIVSYAGAVFMNMVLDSDIVNSPEKVSEFFNAEIVELATMHGMDTTEANMYQPHFKNSQFRTAD